MATDHDRQKTLEDVHRLVESAESPFENVMGG